MSKTAAVSTVVTLSGDGFAAAPLFTETLTNTAAEPPQRVSLLTGFNSIAVPAAALGVLIVPPAGSATALTLKGITGDTGIPIDPGHSTRLTWTAAQVATLGITAGAGVVVELVWL